MKVLQNDYILKTLDLPTIEWKPYDPESEFSEEILWSVKVEEIPKGDSDKEHKSVKQTFLSRLRRKLGKREKALIGADAKTAQEFARKQCKLVDPSEEMLIYYPYYTVVKSGILDINRTRIVIEGTKGDIDNLTTHHRVAVTLIFNEDDVNITGEEQFFTQEEVLPLIDYGKAVRTMAAQDLELDKNIQLYFSFVYRTSELLKPEGDIQLIFYKFKLF